MDTAKHLDGRNIIDMMYDSEDTEVFKALWEKDKDPEEWSRLLHACYWELSYERVGGDLGYLDNPPVNTERIKYLEKLIAFLEGAGVQAVNDAP